MTARDLSLVVLAVCSATVLACSFIEHRVAAVAFWIAALAFTPALIALGASREGRIGRLAAPLLVITVLLEGSGIAVMAFSWRHQPDTWWFGLPAGTVIMLCGLWLLPLLVVSFVFAWDFKRFGLKEEDLERIRDMGRERAIVKAPSQGREE